MYNFGSPQINGPRRAIGPRPAKGSLAGALLVAVCVVAGCGGTSGTAGGLGTTHPATGNAARSADARGPAGATTSATPRAGESLGAPGASTENTGRFASRETWYVVRIGGQVVGFSSEAIEASGDGVRYRSHTDLSMSRMGTPMKMFMLIEELSDSTGAFRSARMELDASVMGMTITSEKHADSVIVRTETAGHERTERIRWEPGAITQALVEERIGDWLETGSDTLTFTVFDSNGGKFKHMRLVRGTWQTAAVGSTTARLLPVREYEGDGPAPMSTAWYNQAHEPVRTVVRQMGLEITIERTTREAMRSIAIAPNFDIIRQSMISCDGFPDDLTTVDAVTLHLEIPGGVPAAADLDGPNQRVLDRGADWADLELTRETANRIALEPAQREGYLSPDAFIQSRAPAIVAVADSIRRASGASGWALAEEIAKWVNGHITEKNYSQGFASALEAMSSSAGDCTEHSVLLTALLRAAGLPARPAVGLVYFRGALAGHMWTEVYDGYWRTLDALDLSTQPIRLRITASGSHEAIDERNLVQAYSFVGGMRARAVSYRSR